MSGETFDDRLKEAGDGPVIVFLGSNTCGPTIAMWPILDEFETSTAIPIISVSVDSSPEVAQRFMIKATPSTIVMRGGEPLGTVTGTMTIDQMVGWVDDLLSPKVEKKVRKKKG